MHGMKELTVPTLLQHWTGPVLQVLPPEGVEAGAVTVIVVVFGGLGADTVTVVVTGGVVVCQGVAAARMVRERRK